LAEWFRDRIKSCVTSVPSVSVTFRLMGRDLLDRFSRFGAL
jgi:hypothetical protein